MNTSIRILVIALAAASMVACKTKKENVIPPDERGDPVVNDTRPPSTEPGESGRGYTVADLKTNPCLIQRTVSFDLDRTEIKPEFMEMVGCHAKFLIQNPSYKLTLEGHADERGTREYNLGLGERRGNAVSDMLKAQSADGGQISVVSYGEERPTCTESDDGCWAQNRRAEFVYSN